MKEYGKISSEELKNVVQLSDEELSEVRGGTSWPCFGSCLLAHGASAVPALTETVAAIRTHDWDRVSQYTRNAPIAALPIVAECMASC